MALTATIDLTVTPPTLTAHSDRRIVTVTVAAAGETATGTATFPITVADASGRVWTPKSDDGVTAVFTG